MKRVSFIAALAVAAVLAGAVLTGCMPEQKLKNCPFTWFYEVKNDTDVAITVVNGKGVSFDIAPDRTVVVGTTLEVADCITEGALGEIHPYSDDVIESSDSDGAFTMKADGADVSGDIWLRQYWAFSSNELERYEATYRLTVTDALLERMTPKGR